MEQSQHNVANEMQGKAEEDDHVSMTTKCVFPPYRKLKFAVYVTQLDNKKHENFLLRFEFASEPMVHFFLSSIVKPSVNCKCFVWG